MALVISSSLFSISPKVWWEGTSLMARTSLVWQALSLGSWCKEVTVDTDARVVTLSWRYLWGLRRERTIAFDAVSHVEYRHAGLTTRWSLLGTATDQHDWFSLALALHDRSEVHLFTFEGNAVLRPGFRIGMQGDQQEQSLFYLDELCAAMGKGLSKFSSRNLVARSAASKPLPLPAAAAGGPPPPTPPPAAPARCAIHDLATARDGRCVLCRRAAAARTSGSDH